MKKLLMLMAVCTCGYATAQNTSGTTSNVTSANQSTQDTAVQNFIMEAAKMDLMEIHSGQLARQKANSERVKSYASKLVQDHTSSSNELRMIAAKKNVSLNNMAGNAQPGQNPSANNPASSNRADRADAANRASGAGTTGTSGTELRDGDSVLLELQLSR